MTQITSDKSANPSHPPSPLSHARKLLRRFGLRPKKRWGQHFLIDTGVLHHIVSAADLSPPDTVVEVGPGLGVLTEQLVQRAGRVFSIELDSALAAALSHAFAGYTNLRVINANVLDIEPHTLFPNDASPKYKVVANIPYYITAPILRHFLEAPLKPQLMVVMVQKEVAQSIVAVRGEMSLLSVAVQFYSRPTVVRYISARSFYPAPKVESALLRIEVYPKPAVDVADPSAFFQTVRAGFSAPRKQLRNALAQGLSISPDEAKILLERAGMDPRQRAETLSLEEWAALHRSVRAEPSKSPC